MAKCYTGYERAIAVYIGHRIELRRKFLRITQKELAQMIDLTSHGHIYRYESGAYMMSAARLAAVAHALNVPMDFFTQGFVYQPEPSNAITS